MFHCFEQFDGLFNSSKIWRDSENTDAPLERNWENNPKYSRMHVKARKCSLLASDESFLTKTPKPECNNLVRITFGFEIEIQANIQSR